MHHNSKIIVSINDIKQRIKLEVDLSLILIRC